MKVVASLADYGSRPVEIVDGDGCWLYDNKGKKYLDFLAGWCVGNIGWKNKNVQEALQKEVERGVYVPPVFRFPQWEEFAELLVKISPNKLLTKVFRCTSGSESVEFAIKCARAATGKKTIVSVDGVYHGHTFGALSAGDECREKIAPCLPNFLKIPMPNFSKGISVKESVEKFEKLIKEKDVAAFLSEPVWTNAGAIIPPSDFYPAIEKICRKNGILLIMDEVATGLGRCGKLFASELWDIKPDILCLAKGLTGGYGTMGATLVTEEVFEKSRGIPSYSTFGWLPLDLAGTKANVEILLKEKLWENSRKIGEYLLQQLKPLEELPNVGEVRGIGLLIGIEIIKGEAQKFQDQCAEEGLVLETAGNALFISPPLILSKELADEGVNIIKKVLGSVRER
jgi:acetylornithine/succinyldiaminopimelate/putrescine aminotransferase